MARQSFPTDFKVRVAPYFFQQLSELLLLMTHGAMQLLRIRILAEKFTACNPFLRKETTNSDSRIKLFGCFLGFALSLTLSLSLLGWDCWHSRLGMTKDTAIPIRTRTIFLPLNAIASVPKITLFASSAVTRTEMTAKLSIVSS